jgi:hypothetical protein
MLKVVFQVFWTKSRVLGQIGRSGKVLGFISSNFGPDPTAGRLLKGNNRGAIIINITAAGAGDRELHIFLYKVASLGFLFSFFFCFFDLIHRSFIDPSLIPSSILHRPFIDPSSTLH